MKDIMISVDLRNSEVTVNTPILGVKGENLQSRFVIDFIEGAPYGTATLEYKKVSGKKGSLALSKDGKVYIGTVPNTMTDEAPTIKCQLKVVSDPTVTWSPIFKSKVFTLAVLDCVDDL